ncbi:high affinity phosphate transporter [Ectocarpus siliculosus]|uniref:High affinity phosphate transporter n=1 Tax=Ectocarpus siliculosus TaxID=2880 RepID=D8LJP8_ECTSI|nr:high affinity phosphate transporter [Ectocarpus siliculosus]|eukprot:CBN77075.1 high affinity phosphate transporter [Ectocarpus siliculosus]
MHTNVEKFDPRVEEVFKGVQVVSAMCDAFAHGAFSVANVTGPIDVIYMVYLHGGVPVEGTPTKDTMECIILFVAAVGMVVGLWTYGHKVMTTIGARIAKITPSRGFSIELGAVLVMITCTRTKVGATVGVALLEGKLGLNFPMLFKIVVGWGATVVICGPACALFFVQGVYAPFAYDTVD